MGPSLTAVTVLFVTAANYAIAQVVQATGNPSCGYLANKIYCFGGATTDPVMNMLDISSNIGSTSDELKNKWARIATNTNNIDIQPRDSAQTMQMPDGKTLLISGGWIYTNTNLVSQTIAFNGESQSWASYANYTDGTYGNRQISHASSVYVPEYGVGFYGGIEINYLSNSNTSYTYPGVNVTAYEVPTTNRRYIGYTSLTFLDIRNPSNPWSTYPIQSSKPAVFWLHQKSIFDAKSNRIFFFGGVYMESSYSDQIYYPFDKSVTFDFAKGEWGTQTLNGQGPTPRMAHTATLLESSQRHVLIYGGQSLTNNDRALQDYCFILDLDTYQWTQQIIPAASGVALARTQHSAVIVNNDTIFIVFGREPSDIQTLAVLMLNVTNPLSITLLDKSIVPTATSPPTSTSEITTNSETKLSTGATVGIAVGATAAGLISIAAIIFCIFRKKNTEKKKRHKMEEIEQQKKQQKEVPLLDVNWDEIDTKYVEVPTHPVGHFNYSPSSADDTTAVDNNSAPNHLSPILVKKGLETQSPNTIDEDSPHVVSKEKVLQKPDGL